MIKEGCTTIKLQKGQLNPNIHEDSIVTIRLYGRIQNADKMHNFTQKRYSLKYKRSTGYQKKEQKLRRFAYFLFCL